MAKKKSKDFMKIKLKAGKKLPKHLNETKPEFKAKKIQIKPLSNFSNLDPIKPLSGSSLSTNLKLVYLGKLKDNLVQSTSHSQGGEQIQVICKYLTDCDSRVRSETINCLKACLGLITKTSGDIGHNITPLISIILTFINCGITHISDSIRNDSQKFLAYIVEKCDSTLDDHLMQMFLSKINSSWMGSLDPEYYSTLEKLIFKIILKNQNKLDNDSSVNGSCSSVLKWSTQNYCTSLDESCSLNKRFSNFQDLNITFQSKSHIDILDKFVETVKSMVCKDIKSLIGKDKNRSLTVQEARKATSALRISMQIGMEQEILQYWVSDTTTNGLHKFSIPSVNIICSSMAKNSMKKAQEKLVSNTSNQINQLLNRYKKLSFKSN